MDEVIVTTVCDDGSCCCLTPRTTVVCISVLSLVVCLADLASADCRDSCCLPRHVNSMRAVLMWFFQMANVILFMSAITESRLLVNVYVWYTLGFVLISFVVAILDLLLASNEGAKVVNFSVEVVFLFVLSRCLPVVNTYIKHLNNRFPLHSY